MALSERLRFFIMSALGAPDLRDELVTAIDNNTAAQTGDIHSDGSVAFAADQPMGTHKLTGLSAGTTAGNSVRYEQVILAAGSNAFSADQSMGSHKLTNVTDPGSAQDAATKAYADLKLATASFTDAAVSSKLITGFVSGAGAVLATDTILQAIDKLDGNISAVVPKATRVAVGFAALNSATSGVPLLVGATLPNKAIVTKVYFQVKTAFTDNGTAGNANTSTISAGIEDQSVDTIASAAISGAPFSTTGFKLGVETGTPSTFVETTTTRQLAVIWTHGSGDSTALVTGSMDVFIEYAQGT